MGIKVNGIDAEIPEVLEPEKTGSSNAAGDVSSDKTGYIREEILNPPADEEPEIVDDPSETETPPTLPKAANGKYYIDGVLANGFVDGLYYEKGVLVTGTRTVNGEKMYFENGEPAFHVEKTTQYTGTGMGPYGSRSSQVVETVYGDDGRLLTGEYNHRMYVKGKIFTGVYEGQYYKGGVPDDTFTGNAKDENNQTVYVKDGEPFTGTKPENRTEEHKTLLGEVRVESYQVTVHYQDGKKLEGIVDGLYYEQGVLVTGKRTINGEEIYFENGEPAAHVSTYTVKNNNLNFGNPRNAQSTTTSYEVRYGDDGRLLTGEYNHRMYVKGKIFTGVYEGQYYKDGVLDETFTGTTKDEANHSIYCQNGEPFTGTLPSGKTYVDGVLADGLVDGLYYINGNLASGVQSVNGENMYFENGEPAFHVEKTTQYIGIGMGAYGSRSSQVVETIYGDDGHLLTGEYNHRMYYNGKVITGVYDGEYYNNGVLDETFTGNATDVETRKTVYVKDGVIFTGNR